MGSQQDCAEIDCIRDRLAPEVVRAAEKRARALGVGADRVLIASGRISEDVYLQALASSLGVGFEILDEVPRRCCPLSDEQLLDAAAGHFLPLAASGRLVWVLAPRGLAARYLIMQIAQYPRLRSSLRLTSGERLRRFVARHTVPAIGRRAASALRTRRPNLSACPSSPARAMWGALTAMALSAAVAPAFILAAAELALTLLFLGWAGLRLLATLVAASPPQGPTLGRDDRLPVYTVIVPLYREAKALPELFAALLDLDYPREKLDLLIVIEADDPRTRVSIEMMRLGFPFAIVIAPLAGPRTKPKALNSALPFARGEFTVIYDAEDRPESDQLRHAVAAFRRESGDLACLQARLTIDNTRDSWLATVFTAEYAGLFDVLLPGLASLRLPIPLGGSSNHFRTAVLRSADAWDPYNVTEDADLGIRLSRLGYRIGTLTSTTYEEAPTQLKPWLKQRTRWFKGWMQTCLVHMRQPRAAVRDLGAAGFLTFHLVLTGTIIAALIQPLVVAVLLTALLTGAPLLAPEPGLIGTVVNCAHGAALLGGYAASVVLSVVGLFRRGLLSTAWALVFLPLHWLLLSVAAWRALYQLIVDPYRWEKTEHGVARTSRRSERGG